MNIGMRLIESRRALAAWCLLAWIGSLQVAAAGQPVDRLRDDASVPTAAANMGSALSAPPAGPTAPFPTGHGTGDLVPIDRRWAQNKPRLYSKERKRIDPTPPPYTGPPKWRWFLNAGYRQDDLRWSIQGLTPTTLTLPQRYSLLLSELTWSDLNILQLEFGLQRKLSRQFIVKGQVGYGIIFDGENQDSDYWDDNRAVEWSRSLQDSDDGDTWDLSVALGYELLMFSKRFTITPLAGYSYHAQNLTMQNGVQVISDYGWPTPLGPFPSLDSSYDAKWYGPWLGLELGWPAWRTKSAARGLELLTGFEYHWVDFYADAYWNLRMLSFEQEANGNGIVLYGGLRYFFNARWALNFDLKYQDWETDPGSDRFWFGSGPTFETVFNGAEWESVAATVGVTCRW